MNYKLDAIIAGHLGLSPIVQTLYSGVSPEGEPYCRYQPENSSRHLAFSPSSKMEDAWALVTTMANLGEVKLSGNGRYFCAFFPESSRVWFGRGGVSMEDAIARTFAQWRILGNKTIEDVYAAQVASGAIREVADKAEPVVDEPKAAAPSPRLS